MTVDGITHRTPAPFMVMGTQNPIEYEGTFPLPEAQLDRFLIRLELGYPSIQDEKAIMERQRDGHPVIELDQVCEPQEVLELQEAVREIYIDVLVQEYIVAIMNAHPQPRFRLPRRLAARVARAAAAGPGEGDHRWTRLRPTRRRQGARLSRARAPDHPERPGACQRRRPRSRRSRTASSICPCPACGRRSEPGEARRAASTGRDG